MQDNNEEIGYMGKGMETNRINPKDHHLESACKTLCITNLGVSGITTKQRRETHLKLKKFSLIIKFPQNEYKLCLNRLLSLNIRNPNSNGLGPIIGIKILINLIGYKNLK